MFVQSGGCCAGSTPMCFPHGEFILGDIDVLLGEIEGCPFYIDKRLDQAWHQDQFILDVAAGEPEDFSLAAGENLHFVTCSPECAASPRHRSPDEWSTAMKAAVVTDFGSPLQVQDLPIPVPGPGEVLVRIQTSGLCHTDIHAARGDWPVKPTPPFIPGHEGVGHHRESRRRRDHPRGRGSRRDRLAGICLWRMPVLHRRVGDAVSRSSRTPATPSTEPSPSTPSCRQRSPARYRSRSPPTTRRR